MTGMVKTLQRRFIAAAMAAVTVLLLFLVGAINGLHLLSVRSEENRMLELLADNGGIPGELPSMPSGKPGEMPGFPFGDREDGERDRDEKADRDNNRRGLLRVGRFTMDNAMSMRFFLVWFDEDGSIKKVDTSRIWSVTAQEAEEMAAVMWGKAPCRGRSGNFRYLATEELAVFLDVSEQESSVLSVLLISSLIAAVCWMLTALLVVALSRRAILPVALNIQKQKEFVTNAGHEIKTPLAIISANAEALELYNGENKWTRNIRTQVVRLDGLMQDLLTLSKMEEAASLQMEELDLTELARETGEEFKERADARNVRLLLPENRPVTVRVDRRTMNQLISILLDNAVRYTSEGGTISLETGGSGGKVFLRQWNSIAPEMQEEDPERLFDRFYRSDKARTQKSGGYGIGLSAARAIAEAHGGSLHITYEQLRRTGHKNDETGILFTLKL